MKKFYTFLSLAILMLLPAAYMQAQLNGVYTIDNTQAASATNFTSFTQFASTLNAQGVSGPVTVNVGVTSGPYTEQINIIQYTGASATNSVVINGNGRTITFNATSTANRHTIMLSGADYMTWNNLRVIGTNGTSALVVHLWNGANNNTFNNLYIEAPFNGTSTSQVPFSISGSSVAATTSGVAGSNNTVNSCTIVGGYYNTVFYGNTGTPVETNNEVRNSVIRDFYLYGVYNYYCTNTKVRNNIVDRVNRTTVSTTYGIYMTTNTSNALIEGNYVRNLFPGNNTSTSSCYAIYISADATSSAPNLIRNNVVSDIEHNGVLAGMYLTSAAYAYAEHNTISLDAAGSTGGTTYGIYATGPNERVRNNNITIGRGGSGTKYGLYYSTASTNMESNYNNVYISSTSGANYFGYLTNTYNNLAAWQNGTGFDMNSLSVDPQYTNPAAFNYAPTNIAINNMGLPIGIMTDILNTPRSPLAPDMGAYEIFNSACTAAPPTNSFVAPSTSVCPGALIELTLQNTNTYTNSGYVVQWYSSTISLLGGFVAIPGATLNSYLTNPISQNVYFQAVVTCTNNNQSTTSPPGAVLMAPLVQDTVPYFETFETQAQNDLPNCYWSASDQGVNNFTSLTPQTNNRVARNGTGYAYFSANPSATSYFYTNQIMLKTGITYSAAIFYITENVNVNQWADLSLMVGTNQSPAGLQTIASINPVTGQLYNLLSGTFSVTTTGYYYVAIRATSGANVGPYLTIDDLSITIPCSLNSPTLVVLAPTAPVCQGTSINLLATGADAYFWSNGVQGAANTVAPPTNSTYIVSGINTLSRCSTDVPINISIKPTPVVAAFANFPSICTGQSATLSASGAAQYYWTNGFTGATTVVSPTVSTSYTVAGTNSVGCSANASVLITVNSAPLLQASASPTAICRGESTTLMAAGADSYHWASGQLNSNDAEVMIFPQSSAVYTITGTSSNGCLAVSQVIVTVNECVGLSEEWSHKVNIYPNPASDLLNVSGINAASTIILADVAGRIILQQQSEGSSSIIDLSSLHAGVYFMVVQQGEGSHIEKIIKQ